MRLVYRLAESKNCTAEELEDRMSAEEFVNWAAYDRLSPIGPVRFDHLAAMIATTMANLWSKKKFKTKDFLPEWGATPKRGFNKNKIMAYFIGLKADQDRREAKRHGR